MQIDSQNKQTNRTQRILSNNKKPTWNFRYMRGKMFNSTSPQSACDPILHLVRRSHLNFEIKETPFSLFLSIRKSFNKSFRMQPSSQSFSVQPENPLNLLLEQTNELDLIKIENDSLKVRNCELEKANAELVNSYQISEWRAWKD